MPLSAPLFANKLLGRAAEIASAGARCRRRICRHRRGGRNAGILAIHCLRVAIDLTCGGCRVHGRRCEGHRIRDLTGLSKNFGCNRRAIEQHQRREHDACHETSPFYVAALQDRYPCMVAQIELKNYMPAPSPPEPTEPGHSGLMFAARMTLPQISVSTLMRAANSFGVLPTASKPSAGKRSFTSGKAMIAVISRWSAPMISFGVPAGAKSPTQLSPSICG